MPTKKTKAKSQDFLFRGTLAQLDPAVYELQQLEAERQYRKLILIASESTAPLAVREALSSAFGNLYAEGYPDEASRWMSEEEILDHETRLAHYRRNSDPRYYKGVEYADTVEALARRRCAEAFAANGVSADQIYVNIQALSGGPANNAVYHALVQPGDTVMGMNLLHGGHLSHGAPVNRSGKYYNIVHYSVDPSTERIDYDQMEALAKEHKPKMIIGGFSSYPWPADWARLRQIADSVGAYLLTDIAHVAGLVAAGAYPSPMGYAHVITSTTHKTLNGPRGAIILTTDKKLAELIDRAVFPGEQGGPHVNVFGGLALAFKIAKSKEFKQLQAQVVKNAVALTEQLQKRGFRIPFGGTQSHLTNVDCKVVVGPDGTALSGDMAARILDVAGIVVNRNTIPGDRGAMNPSGLRLGTPWITQRGFKEKESRQLADIIADVLLACVPYRDRSETSLSQRAKVDFAVLEDAKLRVRALAEKAGIDFKPSVTGYPHFYYIDDKPKAKGAWVGIEVHGEQATALLNMAIASDIEALTKGAAFLMHTPKGDVHGSIKALPKGGYLLGVKRAQFGLAATWLRALSDGYVSIDAADPQRKAPGPVAVRESKLKVTATTAKATAADKPFYYGIGKSKAKALPKFDWHEPSEAAIKRTALYDTHVALGAKMVPFAGWDMPLRYSSVREEHAAVRTAAGLFDVTHMGVYDVSGPQAASFLDSVCGNDITSLPVGMSIYTHFMDADANVLDDLLVYRMADEHYLVVVNAANDDKNWAWLTAVQAGAVLVDAQQPGALAFGRGARLRNLRSASSGKAQRVDIALQGPKSRKVLLGLEANAADKHIIRKLKRFGVAKVKLGGFDLILSRTGYTGEPVSFELFVHPDQAVALWTALMAAGEKHGLRPCGLASRDSLRIEAGLPLYGHELAGPLNLGIGHSGFRAFVKTYKPWFVGRSAFLMQEEERKREVVRFRLPQGVRIAHQGDPVTDAEGKRIGEVTSCSLDSEGTLTGQALVNKKHGKEGSTILVYQGMAGKELAGATPTEATVVSRMLVR
ncbi:MAG: glycine cleavage system aminomethyltransferase GcvT [Anaerolineales bacterium]|nr:glycine cleavage system aminomethyltransferase GcvT [Anaerolineales bacterium]